MLKPHVGSFLAAVAAAGILCYALLFPARYTSQAQIGSGAPPLGDRVRGPEARREALALWVEQEAADANAPLAAESERRPRELAAAEPELERLRATASPNGNSVGQPSGVTDRELTDLAGELNRLRAQRSEADARAQVALELMRRNALDAIPDVQKSPLVQGLIAQRVRAERDLAEAAIQLQPAHPRMKQLNATLADIRRHLQREATAIVAGIQREAEALALREKIQSRALDEAKVRRGIIGDDRPRHAQIEDDANAMRRELVGLRERSAASSSGGSIEPAPGEAQVITAALASTHTSWPNPLQVVGFATAAIFVTGLVTLLLRLLPGRVTG